MQYARPELTEPFLKQFVKTQGNNEQELNEAQGWLLMTLKEIYLRGHSDTITSVSTTSKSLIYIHRAMALPKQHAYMNTSILTHTYLESLSYACKSGDEAQLDVTKLKLVLGHLDHLMFVSGFIYHSWIVSTLHLLLITCH